MTDGHTDGRTDGHTDRQGRCVKCPRWRLKSFSPFNCLLTITELQLPAIDKSI